MRVGMVNGICCWHRTFPTLYESFYIVWLNSSSSGSMKKIPRNCLVLSSFGFSIVHFCFAFSLHQPCASTHLATHRLDEKLFVFLKDHVYPSGGLSFSKMILVKPVHASENSLSTVQFFSNNTSSDVYAVLVTSMYFVGRGNVSSFGMYSLTLGTT